MGNLWAKVQDFLLNKALGRVIVRVAASAAAALAAGKLGAPLSVDPSQLAAILTGGVNALISLLKPRIPALANVAPLSVPPVA